MAILKILKEPTEELGCKIAALEKILRIEPIMVGGVHATEYVPEFGAEVLLFRVGLNTMPFESEGEARITIRKTNNSILYASGATQDRGKIWQVVSVSYLPVGEVNAQMIYHNPDVPNERQCDIPKHKSKG